MLGLVALSFVLAVASPAAAGPDATIVAFSPSATYTENFDTNGNWVNVTGTSLIAYGTKEYADAAHSEVTFRGEVALRESSGTQDGFAKTRSGDYAWRLRDADGSFWQAKVTTGGVGTFSVWVRRWDSSPDPSYVVEYSIDNGANWTSVQTINNAWLGSSDWKQVSGTINTSNGAGNSDDIIVRIRRTAGERLMVDDFEMTDYTGGGDSAPTVTSTDPTDGATGVAVDATITVTFSEAVTFNSQVEINCPGSGVQNVTPAGGPTAWTLPHTDFQNSETCTVTIDAADVSDTDTEDPPDNMGADTSWSFTTVGAGGVDLLINEVDADTPGTDAAEFVELYDGGAGNTALDGFVVVLFNGNGDVSYAAYDLDGYVTDASGYIVLGNAGVPGVDLVFSDNFLQNGPDAVALYLGDATDFPNGTAVTTANLIDAIVYDTDDADDAGLLVLLNAGQPQVNENGRSKVTDHSSQRCLNGAGGARNTASYDQFSPTPGTVNLCPDYIHEIQGSGSSCIAGTFTVEAIVVGDYQGVTGVDDYKLDGFFIQEEDADVDGDAATSEGIFVYCATCPTNVVVGDKVQVTGSSSEYFNMSQLNATTAGAVVVVSSGNTLPTPAAITLPVPGVTATDLAGAETQINAYYEPFEGMLVQVAEQLSVTEYFELSRYGQLVLAQGGRFRQFTDTNAPTAAGYTAHQIDLARRTIILDDDSNQQNHALMEDPD
ncbi:MAG: hypothetical protein CVT82_15830, partial [Alphaproteobacteria bacterium HGW-Alphaproteobacteria-4]